MGPVSRRRHGSQKADLSTFRERHTKSKESIHLEGTGQSYTKSDRRILDLHSCRLAPINQDRNIEEETPGESLPPPASAAFAAIGPRCRSARCEAFQGTKLDIGHRR